MVNQANRPRMVLDARSAAELRALGSFKDVRALAQRAIGGRWRLSARGWAQLWEALQDARALGDPQDGAGTYFVSPAAEAIFYLVELDGEARRRKLGITARHMGDKDAAKAWRDGLARLLHPDRCRHPGAERAMAKVNEIYVAMLAA